MFRVAPNANRGKSIIGITAPIPSITMIITPVSRLSDIR